MIECHRFFILQIQGLSFPFVEMGMQPVHIMDEVSKTLWRLQPVPSLVASSHVFSVKV
jgi:hypothetical protein